MLGHDIQEHILQVGLADFDIFRVQTGPAHGAQVVLDLQRVVRRELDDTTGNARLIGQHLGQLGIQLEPQYVAGRRLEQLTGTVQRDHAPRLEHCDAAAQSLRLFQVMGGQQNCVALFVEFGDEMPQSLAQFNVDASGRFVEHDHGRLVHQRLRHQHAPLHAARKLAHIGVGLVGQAKAVEQFVDPCVVVPDAKVAGLDAQRLTHVEEWVENQFLRYHTQLAPRRGIVGLYVASKNHHATLRGTREARKNADHGGLARAIRTQQSKKLALFYVQADAIKRQ